MDIVVTLPLTETEHLNDKINALAIGEYAYWNMKRIPKKINSDSKVFVTSETWINGYFTFQYIGDNKIYFEEYFRITPIRMKGFQGFRYRNFDYQSE